MISSLLFLCVYSCACACACACVCGVCACVCVCVSVCVCVCVCVCVVSTSGGVYTPAAAFGNTRLVQNLDDTGKIKFEVIPETVA